MTVQRAPDRLPVRRAQFALVAVLLAASLLSTSAGAVPVLNRDVAGAAGDFVSGNGITLGFTIGEGAVGLAFPFSGGTAEVAGFWGPGNVPIVGIGPENPLTTGVDLRIVPNPSASSTTFHLWVPSFADGRTPRTLIFDTRGRLVRALDGRPTRTFHVVFDWDGTDASGSAAPSGIYFCRVEAGPHRLTRRLALIR